MAGAEPVKIPTRTLGDRTDQHATVGVSRNRTPRRQDPGAGKFWNSVLFIFILYQRSHVYTWFKSQERISLAVQWLRTRGRRFDFWSGKTPQAEGQLNLSHQEEEPPMLNATRESPHAARAISTVKNKFKKESKD